MPRSPWAAKLLLAELNPAGTDSNAASEPVVADGLMASAQAMPSRAAVPPTARRSAVFMAISSASSPACIAGLHWRHGPARAPLRHFNWTRGDLRHMGAARALAKGAATDDVHLRPPSRRSLSTPIHD